MSHNSNYRGVVLSSEQYRQISGNIAFKHVIHFAMPSAEPERSKYLDAFWFRIGYSQSMTIIVVSKSSDVINELIHVGLLCDMRSLKMPLSQGSVYDLLHEVLHGRSTRISLCDEIRDVLSQRGPLRWCGAEKESLFNENIYKNCTEICGNNPPGAFFHITTGMQSDMPKPMHESHMRVLYDDITCAFDDPGQIKLGLIACALPRVGFNMIYVGGSPGSAWIHALSLRKFSGKILCIDPDDLDLRRDHTLEIMHVKEFVNSVEDIKKAIQISALPPQDQLIFVWDVRRGDASQLSSSERNDAIREEASILSNIINSPWFRENVKVYQLKINSSNIDAYSLPANTRLYVQPYTLDRNVYELRAAGHIGRSDFHMVCITTQNISSLREYYTGIKEQLDRREISNYVLFLNFLTSMYRVCDYIDEEPLTNNLWEVALYTLNWNSTIKIRKYLTRIFNSDVKFVGSFFTSQQLSDGEYPFPEELLLEEFPSLVFDSRALIPAKLSNLYFFVNIQDCRYMDNELMFSESYLIGSTEYDLHSSNSMPTYDLLRTELSAAMGCVYAKFPNSFSVRDELVSPSGHSLRMFIEYTKGNASLCMFAFKIMTNFFNCGVRKISESKRDILFPTQKSPWIPELSPRFNNRKTRLERSDHGIWHSKDEWQIGYMAGQILSGAHETEKEAVLNFLRVHINCDLKGLEIFKFMQRGWSGHSAADLRLPRSPQIADCNDVLVQNANKIYQKLFRLKKDDWCAWILSPGKNASTKEWRWAVHVLSLDASARDFYIHTSYIDAITNRYPSHDSSKRGLLELVLNTLIRTNPQNRCWAAIPHYLANDHHPLHEEMKSRFPRLLQKLHVMDDFGAIYTILRDAWQSIQDDRDARIIYPFTNYNELAADLMARRWQLNFPFERVVNPRQLRNVHEFAANEPNVILKELDRAIETILDEDKLYLKRDVEAILESKMKGLFP
uniref:Uncharacterized protein n=1 Tax=Hubei lepidoptera virus 5 TaxID=1922907 RepID=A0A1L3KP08_9VIRU|nr:hypothetical protein 1 [Hubei lepidoptera virus 5]